MQDLDKAAMGRRIRQIRARAGLRQWELAERLGTTQSAVHKYEHGVVPEPRRLVEIARVGDTTIEWILTGRHWEDGSAEQERLSPEWLDTASLLRATLGQGRASVDEALRLLRAAIDAIEEDARGADAAGTSEESEATLTLLEAAHRIQRAVVLQVLDDARRRLGDPAPDSDQAR